MSRVGNTPVAIAKGVDVAIKDRNVTVKGKGGSLAYQHRPEVDVKVEDGQVIVQRKKNDRASRAYHGLTRALINNMIVGVTDGFKRVLEVHGVGWTAALKGKTVELKVGYADTRIVDVPDGLNVAIQNNVITITGADKQAVGQLAARIRSHRKPEPYNGKGIKYDDEVIVRKEGKAFGSGG